ncbi:unnamed protein product [Phyllotreta striolata]|uniref:Uncharacterized protein n=1 Tax=Phyllotreta striolata TaxID=444603 RepID=A0A9N9TY85_PHYSR|nr:unnamed protein product [Phyllotreta striolata]
MLFILKIIFFVCFCNYSVGLRSNEIDRRPHPSPTPYHDWDYLVFSQRWSITSCVDWKNKNSNHTCNLPTVNDKWIIHGIWPTKRGTEGPVFCPSAVHFDPTLLQPFLNDLDEQWTNVEAGTKEYSFWSHEWDKHGTCSIDLPQLNSIPNFFMKGLELNKKYNLLEYLSTSKITPGKLGYTVQQIEEAIKSATNHEPKIECIVDSHTKEPLISEIQICLDKSFEVIDCERGRDNSTIISDCSLKKSIMYLDTVSENEIYYQMDYSNDNTDDADNSASLYELYKFIKLLIRFSL